MEKKQGTAAAALDPVALLAMRALPPSSIQEVADEIGVSAPYISQILLRNRRCSDKVLKYLGLERVVSIEYRRITA